MPLSQAAPGVERLQGELHAFIALLAFAAPSAHASFGGVPCRDDFVCHFVVWGVLVGAVAGIPLSSLGFVVLHLFFGNSARSKIAQVLAGAIMGAVTYEIAAAAGALFGTWGWDPMFGLLLVWTLLAAGSVAYARSRPHRRISGDDGDAAQKAGAGRLDARPHPRYCCCAACCCSQALSVCRPMINCCTSVAPS